MRKTTNLGLSLYDGIDKFKITGDSDSLNHNMEILDQNAYGVSSEILGLRKDLESYANNKYPIDLGELVVGAIVASSGTLDKSQIGYRSTGYVNCHGLGKIAIKNTAMSQYGFSFFDNLKDTAIAYYAGSDYTYGELFEVTVPENAYYFRVCCKLADYNTPEVFFTKVVDYVESLKIRDGDLSRSKVDEEFENTLAKADSAMQPSVYDKNEKCEDVYEYADTKAAEVHGQLNDAVAEIENSIRESVQESERYTDGRFDSYKAFSILQVEELPETGEDFIFYLVPNKSNTGFDKYWWITNGDGTHKWDSFGSSTTLVVDSLDSITPDVDTDYILKKDGGYLYYKYIDNDWRIITGSQPHILTELPDTGSEFADYYILDNDSGNYLHYRYINGGFKIIGGNAYTKEQVDTFIGSLKREVDANTEAISSNTTNINALSQTVDKVRSDLDNLDTEGYTYYHTVTQDSDSNYLLTLYQVKGGAEEVASQSVLPAGGGGSSSTSSITIERITPSPFIISSTDPAIIEMNFYSTDADGQSVDANYTWKSGSTVLMSGSLVQGKNSFDLSQYTTIGTQKFTFLVTDEAGSVAMRSWTIQKVDVRIESTYNDRYTVPVGRSVSFSYTPYGAIAKTIHFKVDGVEETVVTSSSGTLQSYTIPAKEHGAHLLEAWITATINNTEIETSHIYRDIIWYDDVEHETGYKPPVIGCIYRNDYYGILKARQYDSTQIVYNVFDPSTSYPVVKRYEDDVLVSTDTLTSSQNIWNYQSSKVGPHTLKIVCGVTTVTINVEISELGIDVSPVTGNLEVDFNPVGITNSSEDREWHNDKYKFTMSDNFDWANGGYKLDEKGHTYFLIKAGTHVTLNYYMFDGGLTNNPSITGTEMKLVFMVENVQDAKAVWMTNVESTVSESTGATVNMGIQMSAHNGWLKTNNASDSDTEAGVAATNTYLHMPYSEEDIIEMDINIDVLDRDDPTSKAFAMEYEDGVPAKSFVYDSSDRFYQYTPKPIVIGSESCDVRIYRLKIYSASLTTENIMKNFIADSRDSSTMLARYKRNSIYFNNETGKYTPYSGEGKLLPDKLAPVIPNVKVLMLETDHFTTSKKVFVKANLRCIHAPGGDLYPGDPYYDNWLFENGWHSGQGTTSDNYGNAGRNQDYLFNCDGVHKPSDKIKNPEPDYISQVTLGYNTENAHTERCTDWKGDSGKITLTRTSVPNNFFNLKVNIASSDNANNALMQKRYNDFLPYISPAKKRDSRIKNDMEFVPAIVFIRETNPDISTHTEFLDTEWHFYAIGNLGDSKKTDYTRAYDPKDMNEFTIEISDNTKNNATFQSGVYLDSSGNRRIEKFTLVESVNDDGETVYTPVSIAKPSKFIYPITLEEWESPDNMRHWCLYNEAFDGDHSFEPRYACCGDFRDGKLVNDTTGQGKAQIAKNEGVWRAFCRWVVTSTDEEFVNELDQWCVKTAVLFFYAYTHMYTMMDNRAKNTFWHYAKTDEYREVTRPVPELLHVYYELIDGKYVTTTDNEINSGKTYYTNRAFDMWKYDCDTCLGINNNGELVFPYGKEDTDYNVEGDPSSGYVFNGAMSTFWCRLRDLFQSEIESTFNSVVAECFSDTHLINQFDAFQECFPEELWRLNITREYIRTFTGESIDNSIPKHDVQYLRDMMQGKKKYQRRQWIRDQTIYFGTKALMNTVVGDNNRITFRCFTPTGDNVVVKPDYTLKITPFSDMYIRVMFGNGGVESVRAKAGLEYSIKCPLSSMDDTQVTIYGANRIAGLNDLSACYIAANNFSMATKLRKLGLGNTTPGYSNTRLVSLTIGANKSLVELDIRNCEYLTGSLNVAQCNNLTTLYAEGTKITGVIFATNGKIRIAHLPDTINTLAMRNLNDLVDFQCTLTALETLTLEGGTFDSLEVVQNTINTLRVLYLYNIDWTLGDTSLLNRMVKLFYSLVTGSCYVSGQIRLQEIGEYKKAWSDLEVTYNSENLVPQFIATYVNKDGSVLYEAYVDRGSTPPDPVAEGWIETPTTESTEKSDFAYSGWDDITSIMTTNRTITAQYTETIREYRVRWFSKDGVQLPYGPVVVPYGSEVVYGGETPTDTSEESGLVYNLFIGWDKSTGFIRENTDVYALWDRGTLPSIGEELKDMSVSQIYGISLLKKAKEYFEIKDYIDINMGKDLPFSNVRSKLLLENKYFDGNTVVETDIKLFDENQESFVLAIDYRFEDPTTNSTLVSCFEEDGLEGFRLRYSNGPNVQWGDKNCAAGFESYRGLVVLRHVKGENKLHVYTFNKSIVYDSDITYSLLVRSRETSTESNLVFGAVKFLADGGYDSYGKGMIFWSKIWYDDLGDSNCRYLASWPHEVYRAEFASSEYYRLGGGVSTKAQFNFAFNNLLTYLSRMMDSNWNEGGWEKSILRNLLNNRFFKALPIAWQQAIKSIQYTSDRGQTNVLGYANNVTEDKVYIPYDYQPTYVEWHTSSEARIKYIGIVIPDNSRLFTTEYDPTENESVKDGDRWGMYIYASNPTSLNLSYESIQATNGGVWIKSKEWWIVTSEYSDMWNYINIDGNVSTFGCSEYIGICPMFSV